MMLLILTSVLGYELKTAVGTSVFIMAFTAFTGAASHFAIGGAPDWTVLILCVLFTLIWARNCGCSLQTRLRKDIEPCDRSHTGAAWNCSYVVFSDSIRRCIIKLFEIFRKIVSSYLYFLYTGHMKP